MKILYLIPARGGSKGIPHKNRKPFAGKPLVCYAIDGARAAGALDEDICVSTDDEELIRIVEDYGLKVPFVRPGSLARDGSGTYEVILHALDFFEEQGVHYEAVVLLQPTSPFRTGKHITEAVALYTPTCDMVVSVVEAKSNPYFVMFKEDEQGYLQHLLEATFTRRQDCPAVYEYNGAVYVMSTTSLRLQPISAFTKNIKYVMSGRDSVDLDTPEDWDYAEYLYRQDSDMR